jgi:competence protein ComEC
VLRGLSGELPWHDRSLDLVIATHMQADHATGLIDVIHRYDVHRVAVPPADDDSLTGRSLLLAAAGETTVEFVSAGDSFDLGDGVRLDVLLPARGDDLSGNDASLVLRLSWRDVSFLLGGDIEARGERGLVESGIELESTVLKVAHHGSGTSSTREFLDAVQPAVAVISSGAGNRFGHPAQSVVERLDNYAAIYGTAERGSVHFETDGHRLWIETDR